MNHQFTTNNQSTQQQMGSRSRSQQKVNQQIWNNRRFPHIFGTFVHSPPITPSLKDLIASENEFQQSILMSKSQIKHLENQRNTIKRYLISKGANLQQPSSTTSTMSVGMNPNSTGFTNSVVKSNNKHNNNSNILIPNQVLPNEQTMMNNPKTRRQPRNSIQNNLSQTNTTKFTANHNNPKNDPQIRKRKSPGELNKEKSTRKGFNLNDASLEISNTHKRQRSNTISQTRTYNTQKSQVRKKTKRRSNRKKSKFKDENSDDEIKRIIEQINFFDSEDNETDSEEDDFISTRTEPSKVWDHLSPWLEEFTAESVEFLQQTDLIKEGYSQIPPLYQISWNFQDLSTTNINDQNSQSHASENKTKTQQQQKLRNEIEKSSRVFCRLLGSLIESDTKSSHLAHKNKRLVTQLDQLKNSYQYWRNPKDPRFPRKYNGINTKQIISRSSQYTHSQIPIIKKNGNLSLKAMSELIKVGLIIEPSSDLQQEDDDPIYQRLKILMTQLHKVVKINNKSRQLMYESTKEIVRKENNWKKRFKEILETEKKYKDSLIQTNGKKKKTKKKK
ncbi:hypothetical protein M0813_19569 [Anaeramoeba flamelloides]|uniref:Uncharacterized protein n=1 Tax=Anaeramoeba flamelloides TaxID=1746091 RepID=A0ABQ8YNV9_9EUKA|nr:hypothetical protein M0813_19569 [Anaeramoeba flamelloides]